MKSLPKVLFVLAPLFLLLLFAAPIWRITLEAPQYPGGVTLYIWINKLSGDSPGTLQNINILNHYIGMKYIEPDSIPELSYFPYIIIAMAVLGVALGLFAGHRYWIAWLVLLAVLGALGIYDFYLWEYDYGHNLAPDAPIKIPGMAYQPPLIGSKMLLNFNAISYPHTGFLFVLICFILGAAAVLIKMNQLKKS